MDSVRVEVSEFEERGLYKEEAQGEMNIPIGRIHSNRDFDTLDEPVKHTILRDLKAVGRKFFYVLYPKESKSLLREWDLWGPLILCTFLASLLQPHSDDENSHDGGPQFAEVFVIVWVGSAVVTLNCKLLGGNISFFQSVCVLGYCLLPSCFSLIVCRILLLGGSDSLILRFIISFLGFGWASYAAVKFLGNSQLNSRRALTVYPIFLFYFFIGWLILSHGESD